jgi:tripartite-type tricarboxylate transporter receptor subunit TctC
LAQRVFIILGLNPLFFEESVFSVSVRPACRLTLKGYLQELKMKRLLVIAAAAMTLLAQAQNFPGTKPITFVVPFAAGGPTDRVARDLAEAMRAPLGGAIVLVDNAAGAGGSIGANKVAKASPDGHTLLLHHIGMATMPTLVRKLGFQVDNDFTYLGMIHEVPMTIVSRPNLEAKDYKQLTAWIAKNKDKVNLGNAGVGSASHLCGLLWQASLRTEMVGIPYKGGGQAVVDLVSGHVPVAVLGTAPLVPQVKAGRVKLLAVTSATRSKAFPDVPTLAELGFKFMDISQWFGAMAPMGTPPEVVNRLSVAYNKALADPKTVQRLFDAALETVGGTPEEMTKRMAAETVLWSKAARDAGLGK